MLCLSTTPVGYSVNNTDCNDNNAAINPATAWILDNDKDGYYGRIFIQCTSPGTGYIIKTNQLPGDCSDNNASVNPGAVEVCGNRIDDNCNGIVDEATCYPCQNATNLLTTNITTTSAKFNWTSIANPVQWQVEYKTTKLGSKWVDVFVTGNKRSFILTGLLSNQNYQWQIRAKCGSTWTSYSASASFRTNGSSSLARIAQPIDKLNEPVVPSISLYPNPGNGLFNLHLQLDTKMSGTAIVSIVDMTGRKVYTEKCTLVNGLLNKKIQLPANTLKGVYPVEVITENKVYTSKFVLIQ